MNTQTIQAQQIAAAFTRGRQAGQESAASRLEAEIRYAFEEGHKTARERAYKLIAIASVLAFTAGAWLF